MRPAGNRVSSLALALLLAIVAALLGGACGGGATETETATRPDSESDEGEVKEYSGTRRTKNPTAWRWKGKRMECFFRHRDRCFDKLEAACDAARCGDAECVHDESAPAIVSCRK